MPQGIPSTRSRSDIAPLTVRRLKNARLVKIGAFKSMSQKEDRRTKEKYEVEQVKLSLDFDSGHIMRNEDGEPVLDKDGNEQPHYINEGFVTLSDNKKAKLVTILKALGLDGPEFIQQDGRDAGALTEEAADSLRVVFGTNGLGDDYRGRDWDDLPFYTLPRDGGTLPKRDVEVPVLSLTILGVEVIGRWLDMAIHINNGYNRVESYMVSEEPAPLDRNAPAQGIRPEKERLAPEDEDEPFPPRDEVKVEKAPPPTSKGARYVHKVLTEAGVPEPFHVRVAQLMSGASNEDFTRLEDMPTDYARNFRDMHKSDETLVHKSLELAMKDGGNADDVPFEADEDEDDF